MPNFRYVGGAPARIYHHNKVVEFSAYGQLVELGDDEAEAARQGKLALLPTAEYDRIHFPDDSKKYARFEMHAHADPAFLERRKQAWTAVNSNRGKKDDLLPLTR